MQLPPSLPPHSRIQLEPETQVVAESSVKRPHRSDSSTGTTQEQPSALSIHHPLPENTNHINNKNTMTRLSRSSNQLAAAAVAEKDTLAQKADSQTPHLISRVLRCLNRKRCRLIQKLRSGSMTSSVACVSGGGAAEKMTPDVSLSTLHLFRYATVRERAAIVIGVMFMWYAASWQPISVFILAQMAALMGHYTKHVSLLNRTAAVSGSVNWLALPLLVDDSASLELADGGSSSSSNNNNNNNNNLTESRYSAASVASDYDTFNLMGPFQTYLSHLFGFLDATNTAAADLGNSNNNNNNSNEANNYFTPEVIFELESGEFLRESFEINGCAFALALTQLLAFFLGTCLITWAARRQASHVKLLYYKSCLAQELSWFAGLDSAGGGSGSSLNALVDKYEDGIGMKLALLCYFLGHIALFTLTAFYHLAQMAMFCMPFVLAVGLIIIYLSEWQAVAIGEQAVFGKRSLQLAEEILAAIRTVFTFNGQQKELARYSHSLSPFYRRSLIRHLYTALNTSLSKFSIFACFAAYCFYAHRLFPPHAEQAPSNQAAVLAVMRGAEVSIVNILISIPFMEALQQARGSIARIYAAIERSPRIDPARRQVASGARERSSSGNNDNQQVQEAMDVDDDDRWEPSISFRAVQFSYGAKRQSTADVDEKKAPTLASNGNNSSGGSTCTAKRDTCSSRNTERVLNHFSLDIESGQSIALVGASGSGKSTVLALVQRLYDIDAGELLIGGRDVKGLSVAWLRNQIAFVSQEPSLFDMSIEDNIRLGLRSSSDTAAAADHTYCAPGTDDEEAAPNNEQQMIRQQVIEAARAAGAHEFIEQLPEGYATRVGSAGVQLSGGQKQRIAIARALIRRPRILLLDEPTSALDTASEAQVQVALRAAGAGRTTLTVAHRLSTVQHADRIVVVSGGRVVESGNHDELMAREQSLYRQLYAEQSASLLSQSTDDSDLSSDSECSSSSSPSDSRRSSSAGAVSEREDSDECQTGEAEVGERNVAATAPETCSALSFAELWRFCEVPKWYSLAAAISCLLAGLILPFHLIAHSYLFAAFAFDEPEQIGHRLNSFGLLILSCSSVVFVVSFLEVALPGYVGERMALRLRAKTLDSLLRKPMFYFDMKENSAGSLCDRFNGHICALQSIAGARMATMLEALATLSVGAIYGCGQNLRLSMFCLGFALLVLITTIVESRIVQLESSLQQKFDAQLAHLMSDSLSNIKTIASLNRETFFTNKFAQIIRQREVGIGRTLRWLRTFLTSLKFVMPAMSWSASMYYGCHLLVAGSIDLQTIFIICPVVLFAVNDTFRALVFLPELIKTRKSLESLYRMNAQFCGPDDTQKSARGFYLNNLATGNNGPSANNNNKCWSIKQQQQQPMMRASGRIDFQNVHFAYPSRPGARVLDGFSLAVQPGESVALVGASGSGKSSCVNLLEKLYEYQAGQIKLDNRELSELDTDYVRSQLALVSQEPTLLSYTIGDNIRYGDNSRPVALSEVVEAAKTANIHEFIMSLPDRYDTQLLGSSHASGCQLSGGQRQRLAIARALVRRAPILIFDEATSALDARNETQVQEALDRARVGRTSLTIAHRLACVRHADKIAVLRDGRLVELGKHDELMQLTNGHYRALWRRQHPETTKKQHRSDQ